MEQHIVEILVILMRDYPEGEIKPDEFEPLTNNLISLGYTQNEIETALFWFYNRLEFRRSAVSKGVLSEDSFRCLNEYEKEIITPEAYGYLLELRHLGLLTINEMDEIIERVVTMSEDKVDKEEMKLFVAAQIFTSAPVSFSSIVNPLLRNSNNKYH